MDAKLNCFSENTLVRVVFIFSSKTRVLVWCGRKQAENGPKTSMSLIRVYLLAKTFVFRNEHFKLVFKLKTTPL